MPASKGIIFEKEEENFNLFRLDIFSGQETRITDFSEKSDTGDYVWSEDGKNLIFFRIAQFNNLVLIEDMTDAGD